MAAVARRVMRGVAVGGAAWVLLLLLVLGTGPSARGVGVMAQQCVESPVANCSSLMAPDALPCYCVENNWFYEWTCCFPETPVFPMYQCWCQSAPTAAGIAVTAVIMAVFVLGAALALFREWVRRKKRKAIEAATERTEAKDIEPQEYAAAMEAEGKESTASVAEMESSPGQTKPNETVS
ncbi:hypothetical protein FVE85_6727 [Porphyridium purpureum]|uniref:Uncharacterized protein n=1 Tax=Porphyridium purpureum TaxID=35688 RepID=A0A5J4Z7W6_PORPP|nr:hypothetical protein FVE85_6727 [Porphyridium purpureum]|eukprot:POR7823..scf295_1